ncbi:MAG: PQQ-binding-like beta-propeller repeat protein [Planctomycetota bacterium]
MKRETVCRSWRWVCLAVLGGAALFGADWPQYRGPNCDGSTPETILAAWPPEGPKVLWKAPLGESFGSFVISGGRAFILIARGGDEVCLALDTQTGTPLWTYRLGNTIFEKMGGEGPRSTPATDGGKVYLLGTYLTLACLNAGDGKELWKHDLPKEFGGRTQLRASGINSWGSAASPLLDGNLIFVHGGGKDASFLAFDKTTGDLVWKGQNELLTHSTPVPATLCGQRQIVFFCQSGLVAVAAESGALLWRYPFKFSISAASTPIVYGDIVYCSAGYNMGTEALRVSQSGAGWATTKLWRKEHPFCHHWTTPVCKDGYLYGIYGFKDFVQPGSNPGAPLKCVELATGKEMWSQPGFGSGGATILVDGRVLVQSDAGALVLVEATPAAYKELARFTPLGGKCWTMPAVSGGRIYARNTKMGVCLDVK